MSKLNKSIVERINKEIAEGYTGDEMSLLHSISNEADVKAEDLIPLYNILFSINSMNHSWGWTRQEDQALVTFVEILKDSMNKKDIYEMFAELRGRQRMGVQTHYSLVTRKAKAKAEAQKATEAQTVQTVVENIEVVNNEIDHKAPGLLQSITSMLDNLESKGKDPEAFFGILSKSLKEALKSEKGVSDKELKTSNRLLEAKVSDLEFQLEEAYKVIKNLQNQVAQEKNVSNDLRLELWNLNNMKDSDKIRHLNRIYKVEENGIVKKA